jgi:hypothetical protein
MGYCRFQVGQRLWLRETWGDADRYYQSHENDEPSVIAYAADRSAIQYNAQPPRPIPSWDIAQWNWSRMKWRPSIHMPRWASRITLRVTGVRVERLQDLTDEDARAEGVAPVIWQRRVYPSSLAATVDTTSYRDGFEALWERINGRRAPWVSNPYVWVVSFKRIRP